MKIAISAQGNSLNSAFEPRFGRAPGFIIFDSDSNHISFLDNSQNQTAPQGAGIQTAQMIAEQGAKVLITGNIGPKASQALANTNIQIFQTNANSVQEALDNYQAGTAQPSPSGAAPAGAGVGRGMGGGRGRGPAQGGRGMGGGARGRGPAQGGRGMGGGARGKGPQQGGSGMGGGQSGKGRQ